MTRGAETGAAVLIVEVISSVGEIRPPVERVIWMGVLDVDE